MASRKAGRVTEIAPGTMAEVQLSGMPIVVCNVGGEVHAIDGTCPHRGGPLAHGALHGSIIVCPWHAWEFDCRTGKGDIADVRTYPVHTDNGDLFIDVPV